jgi:hypothetical protein
MFRRVVRLVPALASAQWDASATVTAATAANPRGTTFTRTSTSGSWAPWHYHDANDDDDGPAVQDPAEEHDGDAVYLPDLVMANEAANPSPDRSSAPVPLALVYGPAHDALLAPELRQPSYHPPLVPLGSVYLRTLRRHI